ncbi:YqaA family protein [Marinobacterium jannaschii]|uniref:YqaA family protein n=1 Tax=Marinobacterium jannaschii TaxID=64970 RepID=UPI0004847BDA|nr:DedA family protein [Marinobacterium jannaschii]
MSGSLAALFVSGFISATLFPGGSEALFIWMLQQPDYTGWQLWGAVSAGNALGGIVTLLMGLWLAARYPLRAPDKRWQKQAFGWLQRFGPWALLLSWLPLVGDPLCFVAGWLRLNFIFCLLMITLGKAIRYAGLLLILS